MFTAKVELRKVDSNYLFCQNFTKSGTLLFLNSWNICPTVVAEHSIKH
jgi:hypothetical protein